MSTSSKPAAAPVTQTRAFWVLMAYAVALGVFGAAVGLVFLGAVEGGTTGQQFRERVVLRQSGLRGSRVDWRGPNRRCVSGSRVTSCAAYASSPRRSKRSRPRSPRSLPGRAAAAHEPGFGPLTAAKLVGEIAGAGRFSSDAKLARAAGLAPIPVSSGEPTDTVSTAAATARSTRRSTALRSPGSLPPGDPVRRAQDDPKERPTEKPSAALNATSRAASGTCCARPTRREKHPQHRSIS